MGGIRKLIYLLGGLDNLDHSTLSAIYWYAVKTFPNEGFLLTYSAEYMRGEATISSPVFPVTTSWKNRVLEVSNISQQEYNTQCCGKFGKRFSNSPWSANLHPRMKLVLQNFKKITFRCESIIEGSTASLPMESEFLLLWSHQVLTLSNETRGTAGFLEPLRLTLLIYASVRIWDFYGLTCTERLVDALRSSLENSLSLIQKTAADLLLWIVFIGALASSQTQSRQHYEWFASAFADATRKISLRDWDSLLLVLEEFCFVYRPTDKPVKDVWDKTLHILSGEAKDTT